MTQPTNTASGAAARFTKNPVTIEAVQYTEAVRDAYLFDKVPLPHGVVIPATTTHPPSRKVYSAQAYIDTLEGRMKVSIGDWIIKGVKGEMYPCKDEIFRLTYSRAELASAALPAEQPDTAYAALPDDRESFKAYLKECDEYAIVPDVAGAFNAAWQIASRGQAPACQHRIVDARNAIVKSGYVCLDCRALFAAGDHGAGKAPSVLEDAARLWDAFVEAWRNELGVDKIVNIIGGADKLKAVFLDAARKQGASHD